MSKRRFTTSNIGDGLWRVMRDGRPTAVVIEKGEPPKYRMPQEWAIGIVKDTGTAWLCHDQKSKAQALLTVEWIWEAVELVPSKTTA